MKDNYKKGLEIVVRARVKVKFKGTKTTVFVSDDTIQGLVAKIEHAISQLKQRDDRKEKEC